MVPPIRQALEPLADRVSLAPVYGSVAKGTHTLVERYRSASRCTPPDTGGRLLGADTCGSGPRPSNQPHLALLLFFRHFHRIGPAPWRSPGAVVAQVVGRSMIAGTRLPFAAFKGSVSVLAWPSFAWSVSNPAHIMVLHRDADADRARLSGVDDRPIIRSRILLSRESIVFNRPRIQIAGTRAEMTERKSRRTLGHSRGSRAHEGG